jgi:HEAT repeat protein
MNLRNLRSIYCATFAAALLAAGALNNHAAQSGSPGKETDYLSVLQSNAAPAEKATACKHLAIHGTDASVPALAALLSDKDLASWARIALQAIPGPAADTALREAVGKLDGILLVGVINSIGMRRDAKAATVLAAKLSDTDLEVVAAAAVALGKIGSEAAATALTRALGEKQGNRAPAVAEGCIRCAQNLMAAGKRREAVKLYEAVRKASVPQQKVLEATRGVILARGDDGIPLLLEQLRSPEAKTAGMALRTARELPGKKATAAIAGELRKASPERQPLLLLALADRGDASALPSVVDAARSGSPELRLVAVGVLEKLGNLPSVPVLIECATDANQKLSEAAAAALVRLPGEGVDADLLSRLSKSSGKQREVMIRVAAQRGVEGSLPVILDSTRSPEAGIRSAAIQSVGAIGTEANLPNLVDLLGAAKDARNREDLETALLNISSRSGAKAVAVLQPLMKSADPATRSMALKALASAGGADALASIKAAMQDQNEELQDEAVRTLSAWPNTWPEDAAVAAPLLDLAKNGKKKSHQILALRGYLQYVQGDRNLKTADKAQKVGEVVPLMQRPEEKRLAISVVSDAPCGPTVELLKSFAADPALTNDACGALMKFTGKVSQGLTPEQRREALQFVVEKTSDDALKKRAQERLEGK